MRQRFEQVTRKHHSRASYDADVESAELPPTSERLQQEIQQVLEVIDEALKANADLEHRA